MLKYNISVITGLITYSRVMIIPLNNYLYNSLQLDFEMIKIMCEADKTIVTQIYLHTDEEEVEEEGDDNGFIPLHFLLDCFTVYLTSNISIEANCFCYILNLYPGAAGIKDSRGVSPYQLAVRKNMDVNFIRLLLNANHSIVPKIRRNLNHAARKHAMFLA
jgi:hypothetical protein